MGLGSGLGARHGQQGTDDAESVGEEQCLADALARALDVTAAGGRRDERRRDRRDEGDQEVGREEALTRSTLSRECEGTAHPADPHRVNGAHQRDDGEVGDRRECHAHDLAVEVVALRDRLAQPALLCDESRRTWRNRGRAATEGAVVRQQRERRGGQQKCQHLA